MPGDVSTSTEFSVPVQQALADFILAIADTKRLLGIRYAEWCDGAPALEASVAASAMAQDELGHSRALLPLLKDFPQVDPGIPEEAPRQQYSALAYLEQPFASWPTFVAANILIGESLTVAVESARNSRYVPLRTRAVKILEEERFHWLHGEGWFKRLAAHEKEGMDLAAKVEQILPEALAWLGLPKEVALNREGILDAAPDELRDRLMDRVGPLIAKSSADHLVRSEGGHWVYNGVIPWNRYDPATRRLRKAESV